MLTEFWCKIQFFLGVYTLYPVCTRYAVCGLHFVLTELKWSLSNSKVSLFMTVKRHVQAKISRRSARLLSESTYNTALFIVILKSWLFHSLCQIKLCEINLSMLETELKNRRLMVNNIYLNRKLFNPLRQY